MFQLFGGNFLHMTQFSCWSIKSLGLKLKKHTHLISSFRSFVPRFKGNLMKTFCMNSAQIINTKGLKIRILFIAFFCTHMPFIVCRMQMKGKCLKTKFAISSDKIDFSRFKGFFVSLEDFSEFFGVEFKCSELVKCL